MPDKRKPDERWPFFSEEGQRFLGLCVALAKSADDTHAVAAKPGDGDDDENVGLRSKAAAAETMLLLVASSLAGFYNLWQKACQAAMEDAIAEIDKKKEGKKKGGGSE